MNIIFLSSTEADAAIDQLLRILGVENVSPVDSGLSETRTTLSSEGATSPPEFKKGDRVIITLDWVDELDGRLGKVGEEIPGTVHGMYGETVMVFPNDGADGFNFLPEQLRHANPEPVEEKPAPPKPNTPAERAQLMLAEAEGKKINLLPLDRSVYEYEKVKDTWAFDCYRYEIAGEPFTEPTFKHGDRVVVTLDDSDALEGIGNAGDLILGYFLGASCDNNGRLDYYYVELDDSYSAYPFFPSQIERAENNHE